ncbi:MAG: DUF3450 family protein [Myxococcota bacterium]
MGRLAHMGTTLLVCATLLCAAPSVADEEGEVVRAAERIAKLRRDIDASEEALRTAREVARSRLTSLTAEVDALRSQTAQAEARASTLQQLVRSRNVELDVRAGRGDRLRAPLLGALDRIAQSVALSSPLHRADRVARVEALHEEVAAHKISPREATEQLWSMVEDELELADTTQLTRHVVPVGDEERLVPVVALGTVAIFWSLEGEEGGRIAWNGERWATTRFEEPASVSAIDALMKAEQAGAQATVLALPLPSPAPEGGER